MRGLASIASRISKIESAIPVSEYDHLTTEQVEARLDDLGRELGESLGLGRAVTWSEVKELCEEAGINYSPDLEPFHWEH
jgi:hypothetical protein